MPVSAEEDPQLPPPGTSSDTARTLGNISRSLLVSGQIANQGFPWIFRFQP